MLTEPLDLAHARPAEPVAARPCLYERHPAAQILPVGRIFAGPDEIVGEGGRRESDDMAHDPGAIIAINAPIPISQGQRLRRRRERGDAAGAKSGGQKRRGR